MKAVIIDDEADVRATLRTMIDIYCPTVQVVAEGSSVQEGLRCIHSHQPDLVMLDVHLGQQTGFDLLRQLDHINFYTIFITAHDEYAVKAFKYSAIDYLLKPVAPDDFAEALNRAGRLVSQEMLQMKIQAYLDNQQHEGCPTKIVLKDADNIYLVCVENIIRLEAEGNYCQFFLADGRQLMVSKTLKEYDKLFSGHHFFRPHQSHLINLAHFDRYDRREGGTIYMKDGSSLPVAYRKKDKLLEALTAYH